MAINSLKQFTKKLFLFLNITLAILFLLSCYNSWFNSQYVWFFGLLTLGSFYLLLLLILFILFWLFSIPRFMLINIITIALCWQPLTHLLQLKILSEFKIQKDPVDLRVMTWNVEHFDILEHRTHPERKLQMLGMISEATPDVACFQEMVGNELTPAAINYIPEFMKRMNMKEYHYSFNSKLDFDGRHHFGIITFSKFPIINKQTVSFPPHDYNSIFQYTDIVKGQDTFRVFNLHLQSLKFSDSNLKYIEDPSLDGKADLRNSKNILSKFKNGFLKRRLQSSRIRAEIEKSPYPVVVCGDFNDVPNSYAYDKIGRGLKNVFTERGTGIGRTFYGISPTLRIDNIFVDKRFDVIQYIRVKKKISDHFPIIADIRFLK
jgi:endonuclease/exonuclease/phosphatase family metal-dependent hydrolase